MGKDYLDSDRDANNNINYEDEGERTDNLNTPSHLQTQIDLWLAELHLQRGEQTAAKEALTRAEARLHERYPDQWIPLYSMVTFSDLPYSQALSLGKKQAKIMDAVMAREDIAHHWEQLDLKAIVQQLQK